MTDIVQEIGGQPSGVVVPWVCHQPGSTDHAGRMEIFQALLDWSNTPDSDFYLAGPVYQYPNHNVHLTANGYRWHANQVGKALAATLLDGQSPLSLHVTRATVSGLSVLVDLNVPSPPLIPGDAYVKYVKTTYPNLGFVVVDDGGYVPVHAASIAGQATVMLSLGRRLQSNPVLQTGYNLQKNSDIGTSLCDSDRTLADDIYTFTPGVQDPGEDILTWNGSPLIGQPYPLNNYLALGSLPITAK